MSRHPQRFRAVLRFVVAVIGCWLIVPTSAANELEIVVPAYFYPGGAGSALWANLNSAASQVPLTAIMNPGNGPGMMIDGNYSSAVNSLRAAGGSVIGYVYSSYGNRPLADIYADIDRYANWYAIDGIFVDEMWNAGPQAKVDYYASIYNYVKAKNSNWEVMGNPGTATLENYLLTPTADRLMVFENVGSSYPTYIPSSWNYKYDRSRFVHLVHTESSATSMQSALDRALVNNAGAIYVTADILANPWDSLPSYWSAEVAGVAAINSGLPATGEVARESNPVLDGQIVIDGGRSDWSTISSYPADSDGPLFAPTAEVRWSRVTAANDAERIYFRLQLDSSESSPAPDFGTSQQIYVDTDQSRGTGYVATNQRLSIGAEYAIRGGELWAFSGISQTQNVWAPLGPVLVNSGTAGDIEITLPAAQLGSPSEFHFMLWADNTGSDDFYPEQANQGVSGNYFAYDFVLPGDVDDSGTIDGADLAAWRREFAGTATMADVNRDGVVDASDFTHLRDLVSAGGAQIAAVPEMDSRWLIMLAMLHVWVTMPGSGCSRTTVSTLRGGIR